jgi:hypothetical protein
MDGAADGGAAGDGRVAGDGNSTREKNFRGVQLPFIPKVSGNAFVSVTNRGWYLTWQYNAMGVRSLMTGGNSGSADDSDVLSGLKGTGQVSGSIGQLSGSTRTNKIQSANGAGQLLGSQQADQLKSSQQADHYAGSTGTSFSKELTGNNRLYSLYPYYMNNLRIGKEFKIGSRKGPEWLSGKGVTGTGVIGKGVTGKGVTGTGVTGKGLTAGDHKEFNDGSGQTHTGGLVRKINLELRVDNLFNETYRNELQRFMPGRSYTLSLKFEF